MNDASRWQNLSYQSVDSDADGHRASSSGQLCAGSALPSSHSASAVAASDVDCNDSDASLWRILPYVSRDADADGFSLAASGEVCSGDALPAGYGTTAPQATLADCDDSSATTWRVMMTYGDADGDGVGAGAGEVTCIGTNAPPARSLLGYDPVDDPSDPTAISVSNLELSAWQLTTP
ncbi:hypothetical protein [Steroidobacter agaridevorans]|uniref:hypothetical protein n=1 Tax=Steroidobacter agaridevorans TaxID=2695856 RepID=UPI00137A495C|nr:hypothetical protein [Steroidobacter agaridevorans]